MPSLYNQWQNQTLGSDQNGNQLTWQNQTDPWGNPTPTGGAGSVGNAVPPTPFWTTWGNQTPYANNISGSKSYGFFQPQVPNVSFGGVPNKPVQNPVNPYGNKFLSGPPVQNPSVYSKITPPNQKQNQDRQFQSQNPESRYLGQKPFTPQQKQGFGYAQMRAEANMTPQQKQNQMYGQMRNAASGPNPKNGALFQAAKNPLVLQAQNAAMKSFWSNAYQQLNAALRPVNLPLTQNNGGGGGYGYGGWGYGGGGGSRPYAENLPGAKWTLNQ
jgi:hypothetical protein